MRLNRLQRLALAVLGLGAMSAGVVASIMEWASAGVVSLILPGFILTIFSIVGVFANVHLKEGNLEWPKSDEPKAVEPVTDSRNADIDELRKELAAVNERLEDYVLANKPAPDDGLTDEQRLEQLLGVLQELETDVSYRIFTGESYDDGVATTDLVKTRDFARQEFDREQRRQRAQYTLGMRDKPPKLYA